jgi:hypothetical protein
MGRRQGGVGEASPLCFFGRGQSEDASPTHRSRIDLDMIVAITNPPRYSYLKASAGLRRAACQAGTKPDTIPVITDMKRAVTTSNGEN